VSQPTVGYRCLEPDGSGHEAHKVLLVFPKVGAEAPMSLNLPLSLLNLASFLRDFTVAIHDHRVASLESFRALLAERPVCVGFSTMTGPQITNALELAAEAKALGIPTVFGGVHPSLLPEQTQADPRVDHVVVGEGEAVFRGIVETLLAGRTPPAVNSGPLIGLDDLPELPYELLDVEPYMHSFIGTGRSLPVLFSRGCPYKCTFCCNPVLSPARWRAMDTGLVLSRINAMVDRFRLDSIQFFDEHLFAKPKLLAPLLEGIGGRFKWAAQTRANVLLHYDPAFLEASGAIGLACGLESGSPAMLKKIKKQETVEQYLEVNRRFASTHIRMWYCYIVGYPGETLDDVRMTVQMAMRLLDENPNAGNNVFYLLSPYPGTEIAEKEMVQAMPTEFAKWADFGRHNFVADWHPPERLQLYKRIYFSSKFTGRKLQKVFPGHAGLEELGRTLTEKWKAFDFFDDAEWQAIERTGWAVLKDLFGEHAF
jgi:radical SAM superfamily enzyme YgiQ (UPF0313 family)